MTDAAPLEDEAVESLVSEATDAFLERVHSGQAADVEEYARRYPQIAGILRQVLPAVRLMHHFSSDGGDALGRPALQPFGRLGDFLLLREVGRGGMGVVYEAEQMSLGRRVALKVLPFAAALDPKQLERFKHEAHAAAQLHHTHIVPVYAVGCERGVYYYAMQFIEGQSLSEMIHGLAQASGRPGRKPPESSTTGTGSNLSKTAQYVAPADEDAQAQTPVDGSATGATPRPRSADTTLQARGPNTSTVPSASGRPYFDSVARLGIQAAEALEHAHTFGIVHRDIKPGNLLVDAGGKLWITDFGLARFQTDAGLTLTGDLLGTLRYMSPEQALAKRGLVDHRSDIYSLGATLYELLTLEPVLAGHDRHELLREIAFEEPVPPRRLDPAIPVDLETIVLKAVAKTPEERYGTAQELVDDLRRFLEDKPILARRPTLLEKSRRWSRRHRSVVVSAVVLLLISVVGLAAATALIARKEAETQAAYHGEALERARAEENFKQARQMLDFFTQISADELADKPGVKAVREKLLKAALSYYQDFIEQSGDDPSVRAELGASFAHVGRILNEIGAEPNDLSAFAAPVDWHRACCQGPELALLAQTPVRDDLKLSAEQFDKVRELGAEQHEFFRDLRSSASRDEAQKKFSEHAAHIESRLGEILDADQLKRLKQISLQIHGSFAFRDPEVAKALGLSPEQKRKIMAIQDEAHQKWKSLEHHKRFGEPPAGIEASSKDTREKLLEVLTEDQRSQWREMNGRPLAGKVWIGRPPRLRPGPGGPPEHEP